VNASPYPGLVSGPESPQASHGKRANVGVEWMPKNWLPSVIELTSPRQLDSSRHMHSLQTPDNSDMGHVYKVRAYTNGKADVREAMSGDTQRGK